MSLINHDRRCRGTHSTVCKNKNPIYEVPATHVHRLAFIRDLVQASEKKDVTRSDEAMLARHQDFNGHQKRFYKDRANAINVLHMAFCEHVNLVTHQVEISIRNASDAAGLSTISAAEEEKAKYNPSYSPAVSISRASRAFHDMIDMGWIVAPDTLQVWDKEAGCWIDKYYEVTPLFFNACGITSERVAKQRSSRLGRMQKKAVEGGLSAEEAGRMSVTKIREANRQAWRKRAFERRSTETARKKVQRSMMGKTRHEQRHLAQKRVLESLGNDASQFSMDEFKELVNKEVAMLRKFSGVSAPPQ